MHISGGVATMGGHHGWALWVVVVVVVEEEGGCCLLTCLLTPKLGSRPWYTEYIKVILYGHLVQVLECSLIHTRDVLWS